LGKIIVGVLIIENLANFDEGRKTGLEGAKNIDPNINDRKTFKNIESF
jgi:hypothetical protein